MNTNQREKAAREKIKSLYGTPEGEYGPTLFVSHHLEEVEGEYWVRVYGTDIPEAIQILDSLILVNTWSSADDGNLDVFDFSLPGNITNYLLSARFENGDVAEVTMES